LKIRGARTILRAGTNPLQIKSLVRGAWCTAVAAALTACPHKSETLTPDPTAPLPTAGIAAQPVGVLPLTLVAAEDSLHWEALLGERRAALARCDSIIGALLKARAPEVTWILSDDLTKQQPEMVPDPLRTELRTLAALAGGGRYALVPAGLTYRRATVPGGGPGGVGAQHAASLPRAVATAELTVVLVDVRTGRVGFRTVARGEGDDPWTALTRAVKNLTPGLP